MSLSTAPAAPAAHPGRALPGDAEVRLSGHWLALARAAWAAVAALSLGLLAAALSSAYDQLRNPPAELRASLAQLGLPIGVYAAYTLALAGIFVACSWTVAAV